MTSSIQSVHILGGIVHMHYTYCTQNYTCMLPSNGESQYLLTLQVSKHIEFFFGSVSFLALYVQKLECYFPLRFNPISFKPWHNDPYVLGRCVITFKRIPSCSSRFIQDFMDHYVDRCRFNDVHVRQSLIHCTMTF